MAADMRLTLRLDADSGRATAALRETAEELARLRRSAEEAGGTAGLGLARVAAGARDAGEGVAALAQRFGGLAASLSGLGARAAAVGAVGLAIRRIASAGDEATIALARLAQATGSVAAARDSYEALYRSALATGSGLREATAAFQRFAVAARDIGATRADILAVVSLIQQAGAIGGASQAEISSATLQLAQALASGRLQGDELRAVLEAMPLLAEALARQLGVSVGELRRLGAEGQLTADRVLPALVRAAADVGEEFARLPPTMERGFAQLATAGQRFLADLDQALGLSRAIAAVLSGIAGTLDRVRVAAGLDRTREAALAQRRQEAASIEAELAELERARSAPELSAPPRRGTIQRGAVGAAIQQGGGVERRIEELRRALTEARGEIAALEREAAAEAQAEAEAAVNRRAEFERRESGRALEELRLRLDRRLELEREYRQRLEVIQRAEAAGAAPAAQIAADRASLDRWYREQLAGLDRAALRDGQRLAEERRRLLESLRTPEEAYAAEVERLQRLLGGAAEHQEALNRGLERAKQRYLEASGAARELAEKKRELAREAAEFDKLAESFGRDFGKSLADALLGVRRLDEAMMGFVQRLASGILSRLIEEQIAAPLARAIGGLFGGGGGLGGLFGGLFGWLFGGSGGTAAPSIFHSGGIAGAAAPARPVPEPVFRAIWREAPRFHRGGVLAPGEIPAILRRGEGVFTPEQMRSLGGGDVTVQVIDQRGANAPPVEIEHGRDANGERLVRAVVRAEVARAIRDGALDRDLALAYGIRRAGLR